MVEMGLPRVYIHPQLADGAQRVSFDGTERAMEYPLSG
jgi:hypothetical protein